MLQIIASILQLHVQEESEKARSKLTSQLLHASSLVQRYMLQINNLQQLAQASGAPSEVLAEAGELARALSNVCEQASAVTSGPQKSP